MKREQAEQIAQSMREAIEGGASNSDLVQMIVDVRTAERADEREACAKVCDQIEFVSLNNCCERTASNCADAIRARGE